MTAKLCAIIGILVAGILLVTTPALANTARKYQCGSNVAVLENFSEHGNIVTANTTFTATVVNYLSDVSPNYCTAVAWSAPPDVTALGNRDLNVQCVADAATTYVWEYSGPGYAYLVWGTATRSYEYVRVSSVEHGYSDTAACSTL